MKHQESQSNRGIFPRWADFASQTLVLFSIVTFTLESEPSLSHHKFFYFSEMVVTGLFAIEYLARLYLARDRWGYVRSFYGIIDFLATVPMILSFGIVDLRFARIIRLLRLLRLLKFFRYAESSNRLLRAVKEVKGELGVFAFCIIGMVYVAAVGIHFFESKAQPEAFGSIMMSMWWAFVTLTTVGYGDVFPVTAAGKMFTIVIMFSGLMVVAIPSGLIASSLIEQRRRGHKEPEISSSTQELHDAS